MSNPFDEAEYLPLPELSPYIKHDRYEDPKENFKLIARKLKDITDPDRAYDLADIACANGELLYFLRQQFPHWDYRGYDFCQEFIDCGRSFAGLDGITLDVSDMYDLRGQFDIVTFIGTMHAMWDPEPPLLRLLSLCKAGGVILLDGGFNPYDVEFRAVFMDNSRPEGEGIWRRDFSQHSRSGLAKILNGRCRSFEFEDIPMGVDIPRRPDAPHTNVWTFKDEHGQTMITNGTNAILNKTLLTIHR